MRPTPRATKRRAEDEADEAAAVDGRDDEQREPDHDEAAGEDEDRTAVPDHAGHLVARGGDHHAARRVAEHVVDRAPEEGALGDRERLARRAEHDDLGTALLGLLDDRLPGAARADETVEHPDAVRVADRDRLVELVVRSVLELGQVVVERPAERHLEHVQRHDPGPALGGEAAGDVERVVRGLAGDDGYEEPPVLERERRAEGGWRLDGVRERGLDEAAPVDDVEQEARGDPAEADPARRRVLVDDDEERGAGRDPAENREYRPQRPARSSRSGAPR